MSDECIICKAPLEYLEKDIEMECAICHKKEKSKTRCIKGHYMELKRLSHNLTVCKVNSIKDICFDTEFFFIGKTDEEISLVCKTEDTPTGTIEREDGWNGFRIQGILDFSLIGILSKLSTILAENEIGIFAVSTYNTDYILVKSENFEKAMSVLEEQGYRVV